MDKENKRKTVIENIYLKIRIVDVISLYYRSLSVNCKHLFQLSRIIQYSVTF